MSEHQERIRKLEGLIASHHIRKNGSHTLTQITAGIDICWILKPLVIPKTSFTILYLIEIAKLVKLLLEMNVIENKNNHLSLRDNIYVEIVESFVPVEGVEWLTQATYHYSWLLKVHVSESHPDRLNKLVECAQLAHYSSIITILLDVLFPPAPSTAGQGA